MLSSMINNNCNRSQTKTSDRVNLKNWIYFFFFFLDHLIFRSWPKLEKKRNGNRMLSKNPCLGWSLKVWGVHALLDKHLSAVCTTKQNKIKSFFPFLERKERKKKEKKMLILKVEEKELTWWRASLCRRFLEVEEASLEVPIDMRWMKIVWKNKDAWPTSPFSLHYITLYYTLSFCARCYWGLGMKMHVSKIYFLTWYI